MTAKVRLTVPVELSDEESRRRLRNCNWRSLTMAEQDNLPSADPSSAPPPPPPPFDPTRMVGIIKRKAMIKDLAAVYHAECLAYCQELLELQRKWEWEEPPEDSRKETVRPSKRTKKTR